MPSRRVRSASMTPDALLARIEAFRCQGQSLHVPSYVLEEVEDEFYTLYDLASVRANFRENEQIQRDWNAEWEERWSRYGDDPPNRDEEARRAAAETTRNRYDRNQRRRRAEERRQAQSQAHEDRFAQLRSRLLGAPAPRLRRPENYGREPGYRAFDRLNSRLERAVALNNEGERRAVENEIFVLREYMEPQTRLWRADQEAEQRRSISQEAGQPLVDQESSHLPIEGGQDRRDSDDSDVVVFHTTMPERRSEDIPAWFVARHDRIYAGTEGGGDIQQQWGMYQRFRGTASESGWHDLPSLSPGDSIPSSTLQEAEERRILRRLVETSMYYHRLHQRNLEHSANDYLLHVQGGHIVRSRRLREMAARHLAADEEMAATRSTRIETVLNLLDAVRTGNYVMPLRPVANQQRVTGSTRLPRRSEKEEFNLDLDYEIEHHKFLREGRQWAEEHRDRARLEGNQTAVERFEQVLRSQEIALRGPSLLTHSERRRKRQSEELVMMCARWDYEQLAADFEPYERPEDETITGGSDNPELSTHSDAESPVTSEGALNPDSYTIEVASRVIAEQQEIARRVIATQHENNQRAVQPWSNRRAIIERTPESDEGSTNDVRNQSLPNGLEGIDLDTDELESSDPSSIMAQRRIIRLANNQFLPNGPNGLEDVDPDTYESGSSDSDV
ncbi:MAG: hypothetical protein M1812_002061 [Candelaria pacifica]|nr:MAG: hypothetical protein M1812_002061 [Candelaria pacifica]